MEIAVLGSGNIGGGLARAWRRKNHSVTFGARNPDDPELRTLCNELGARAVAIPDAVAAAEVVVLAVPFAATDQVLAAARSWDGKIVIDATNPVERTASGFGLRYAHTTSGAEELSKKIPGAKVFKSFNAQGAENLEDPLYGGVAASNFFCGDDGDAKCATARTHDARVDQRVAQSRNARHRLQGPSPVKAPRVRRGANDESGEHLARVNGLPRLFRD